METKTVKTTTYETRSSYDSSETPRRRTIGKDRNIQINRGSGGLGGGSMIQRSYHSSYGSAGMAPGSYQVVSQAGVSNVKDSRVKEKKDMQDLNERFASYIEKVRFLEAQNRKLADELEKLKAKWGKETSTIKEMYKEEMEQLRKAHTTASTENGELKARIQDMEDAENLLREEIDDLRASIDRLNRMLQDKQDEVDEKERNLSQARSTVEMMEVERDRNKKEIARLTEALAKLRKSLDEETFAHMEAENLRCQLQDELDFLKEIHDQELKELAALAYRDTTKENRDFWKNEMGNALREIQATYDEKLDGMRGELEGYYSMKIQEFQTGSTRNNMDLANSKEEIKRLRSQLTDNKGRVGNLESELARLQRENGDLCSQMETAEREHAAEAELLKSEVAKLRAEMEAILKELQDLMDTKLGLELEIAAYRKLLEGEENRVSMRSVMDNILSQRTSYEDDDDSSLKVSQVVKGEMSAKTTYQRSAKGPVSVSECATDGRFVVLENGGRKTENLNNWKIARIIDGEPKVTQALPSDFEMKSGQKIKVWTKNAKRSEIGSSDIQLDLANWGLGQNVQTKLVNTNGEDRATHIQKTVYMS